MKVIHSNRRKRWSLEFKNVTRANELPFQLTLQVSAFKSIIQTCLLHPTDTNLIPFQNFSFITNSIKSGFKHSDIEGVQLTHSVCLLHILARYSHMMDSDGNFIRPSHAMVQLVKLSPLHLSLSVLHCLMVRVNKYLDAQPGGLVITIIIITTTILFKFHQPDTRALLIGETNQSESPQIKSNVGFW